MPVSGRGGPTKVGQTVGQVDLPGLRPALADLGKGRTWKLP